MIIIDTPGITEEQKSTPKFQQALAELVAQLSDPNFVDATCWHEAAHVVYLKTLGIEVDYIKPHIRYVPEDGDYELCSAAIKARRRGIPLPGRKQIIAWLDEYLVSIACALAAGGVAECKRSEMLGMPSLSALDGGDRRQFVELCDTIDRNYDICVDPDAIWERGRWTVEQDLKQPGALDFIKQHADLIRPLLGLSNQHNTFF